MERILNSLHQSKLFQWLLLACAFAIGIFVFHGSLFKDNLNFIHGDLGDSRLVSLLLEHNYRYIFQIDKNLSFWSPYWIYTPAKNGLAYSDVMTGGVFLYAPWRIIGLSEMTAYQFWFLATSTTNFASFVLLGSYLRWSMLGIAVGAYALSFGLPNLAYANHPQMLSHYYIIFTLYFLCQSFDSISYLKKAIHSGLAALMYSLQFWLAFYPAWFFGFASGIGILFLLATRWKEAKRNFKDNIFLSSVFLSVFACLVLPLAKKYLMIKNLMGPRSWGEIEIYLPTWQAYLLPTPEASHYFKLLFETFYSKFLHVGEMCMFPGFIVLLTPVAFILSQVLSKKLFDKTDIFMWALAFSLIFMQLFSLKWGTEDSSFSLWRIIFKNIPGASALRAVSRISLIFQIISSMLLAYTLNFLIKKYSKWGSICSIIILVFLITENWVDHRYVFKKDEHKTRVAYVRQQLAQNEVRCQVFHRAYRDDSFPIREIDAMWASLETGIPSSNGYSGGMPPKYWDANIFRAQSTDKIVEWFRINNKTIDSKDICFLQ